MMTMAQVGLLALLAAPAAGPERALISPDGALRVVIESPQGEATWRYGLHPSERTSARIEEAASGRVIAHPALGWSVVGATISPDSRTLTVLCLGYRSQHAREALPREVAVFDLPTGAERGRVPLPYRASELDDPIPDPTTVAPPVHHFLPTDDGRTVLVFAGVEHPKDGPWLRPELMMVDVGSASLRARLELPERADVYCAHLMPEGDRVVLPFQSGKAIDLLYVGIADGAFETLALQAPPTFDLVISGDVTFVFLRPRGKHLFSEPPAQLTILDHGRPGWTLELPRYVEPRMLSADGRRLVLEGSEFVLVDLETGREIRRENPRRRFKRDITLEDFLAGEPGFGPPSPPPRWPDPAPWSTRAEHLACSSVGDMPRGVAH